MKYKVDPLFSRKTRRPDIKDGDVLRTLQECKELIRNTSAFQDVEEKLKSWK